MNVLITYAVDPEFAPWPKLCKFEEIPVGEFTIRRTKIGQADVDFLVTGMGPQFVARAMRTVWHIAYNVYISAGFAGALRPEYEVGDVVVGQRIREAYTKDIIYSDAPLVEAAAPAKVVTLLSSPVIVGSASEKLSVAPVADAVDMESFKVACVAQTRGVPSVAIRVISDRHDQDMPVDFTATLDERGQVSTASVLRMLAGNPGKVGALIRLGRDSKAAAEGLAAFLRGYVDRSFSSQQPVPAKGAGNVPTGMRGGAAPA